MNQNSQHTKINQLLIAIEQYGHSTLYPILCLHGWRDNAASFLPLSSYLQEYYLICPDIVGHGFSDHLPGCCHYSLLDYLFFTLDFISSLPYKSFGIAGHSFGGFLALLISSIIPEKVKFIITIDALGPIVSDGRTAHERLLQHIKNYNVSEPYYFDNEEEAIQTRSVQWKISLDAARLLVSRDLKVVHNKYIWRHDSRLVAHNPLRLTTEQADSFLKKIMAPVCFIHPFSGYPYKKNSIERNLRIIKNITEYQLDGGHHIHMENPIEVSECIKHFFSCKL